MGVRKDVVEKKEDVAEEMEGEEVEVDVAGLEGVAGGALVVSEPDLSRTWLRPLFAKWEKGTLPTPGNLIHATC